jgi:hypothetical protein
MLKQKSMITGFETLTKELTEDELKLVRPICRGLETKTKSNPIKGADIVKAMKKAGHKFSEVRLRKIINFIRTNSMLPVIATSEGYYCSRDKRELTKHIISLNERASAIQRAADGLNKFLM